MTTETKPKPTSPDEIAKALAAPFDPYDIEWRIGQAGTKESRGEVSVWAKCLAYITNRAIMHRLDEVVGIGNWKNEYRPWQIVKDVKGKDVYSQICSLSLRIEGEWIAKEDGADCSEMEPVKGGLSDAMKRAAYQWGIGRYLYDLDSDFADTAMQKPSEGFWRFARTNEKDKPSVAYFWQPPRLPDWALPLDMREKQPEPKQTAPASAPPQEKPADKPKGMTEMHETMAESKRIVATATLSIAEARDFARLDVLQDAIDQRKTEKLLGAGDYDKLLVTILERRVQLAETPDEIGIAESQVASFKEKRRIDSTQAEVWGGNLANKRGRAYAE